MWKSLRGKSRHETTHTKDKKQPKHVKHAKPPEQVCFPNQPSAPARTSVVQHAAWNSQTEMILRPHHFREVRSIGKGNQGRVSLADVTENAPLRELRGTVVALKHMELDEGAGRTESIMEREIQAHKLVTAHPHVVTLHMCFRAGTSRYLVLDHLSGRSVRTALHDERKRLRSTAREDGDDAAQDGNRHRPQRTGLSVPVALEIASQIADAVTYMHARGVAHRDIKPENVILRRRLPRDAGAADVSVCVIDFGVASVFDVGREGQRAALSKAFCGSPAYMAPEQHLRLMYDMRLVDVYALGVMLFEMIVGAQPFVADEESNTVLATLKSHGPRFDTSAWDLVSEEIRVVLRKMLQVDASKRPTMAETLALLEAVQKNV